MPVKNFCIRFSKEQLEIIKAAAEEQGSSPTGYIRWAIDRALAGKDALKKVEQVEAAVTATYLTLHELSRDLYARIPPAPDSIKAECEKEAKASLRDQVARVSAAMSEKAKCQN